MSHSIYLDNNASTPVDPKVMEAMMPWFTRHPGNAASIHHTEGVLARHAVEHTRVQCSGVLGVAPEEVVFARSATDAIRTGLFGLHKRYGKECKRWLAFATEHSAVLDALSEMASWGAEVELLGVDHEGIPSMEALSEALKKPALGVVVSAANHETGVMAPMDEIGALVRSRGALFISDFTQAIGKMPIHVNEWQVSMAFWSAHKFYGPKGAGGLLVRKRKPNLELLPYFKGGKEEMGLMAGTLDVPAVVGMGAAMELAESAWWDEGVRLSRWRTWLEQQLVAEVGAVVHGSTRHRLCNTTNLAMPGVLNRSLFRALPEVCISSGAACSSDKEAPSPVLLAMGIPESEIAETVRISLGRFTEHSEVIRARELIVKAATALRTAIE
jgi:cysteine desulfurase